jgi:hypothetical protein
MSPNGYFKACAPELRGAIGCCFFDGTSVESVSRAYAIAGALASQFQGGIVVVWGRPSVPGPWSRTPEVGAYVFDFSRAEAS